MKPVSIDDYRELARRRLPPFLFDYIDGGAFDEVTLGRNVADLREVALRQRVLTNVSDIDLSTTLLGQQWSLPVALGPIGLAGLNARRGEVQAARAAEAAGARFCLSMVAASWTGPSPPPAPCRAWSPPSPDGSRCWRTAACARASTWSGCWPWERTACCWGAPGPMRWRRGANGASRTCSPSSAPR